MNLQQLESALKNQIESPTGFVQTVTVDELGRAKFGKSNERDRKLASSLLAQLQSWTGHTKPSESGE